MTTEEKIAELRRLASTGENKPACAQVLEVNWSAAVTRYYAWTNYGELSPYQNIPFGPIEARILNTPFSEFEIQPDLRTDTIEVVFDDIDGQIKAFFQRYGTVKCKFHYYWPDVDLTQEVWHGLLQVPQVFGYSRQTSIATNGYTSREKLIPHLDRPPDHCRYDKFGGELPNRYALETSGCPWDRHLPDGATGLLKDGTDLFIGCPKDSAACQERFGHTRFFGGYSTDASATVSDGNTGHLAISKGNTSSNTQSIPWLFGTKYVRGLNLLMYRREPHGDTGWFAGVWEVSEMQSKSIHNIKINDKLIEQQHISIRGGALGQPPVANYNAGGTISNFSGVFVFSARYGWVNADQVVPSSMNAEALVEGDWNIAVFNATDAGAGLVGNYYSDLFYTNLYGQRTDHNLNFPTSYSPPLPGMSNAGFSMRWTGTITFPFNEPYTISVLHDDGAGVWIDGTQIVDGFSGVGTHTGTFTPVPNVEYAFRCDFQQSTWPAPNPWYLQVSWSSPSTPIQIIPNSAFKHPAVSSGYVRQWSNDRVWGILELYTNQRVGLGYNIDEVTTEDFKTASIWGLRNVTFSFTSPDGEIRTFSHRRTKLDAYYEGRSAVTQIVDTCRSGALSVPFQHNGKLTIRPFRAFTSEELAAAPVFTDKISNQSSTKRRIVHDDGPAIQVRKVPDELLPNEIKVSFEAADNFDAARTITADDPNQKLKAGKKLGVNSLETIPKRYAGFGIRHKEEAVKMAYRFLWFGDEGASAESDDTHGVKNNCKVIFYTPYEMAIDLVRYGPIKIDCDSLEGHGYGDPFAADQTPPSTPEGYGAEYVDGTEITLTLGTSDDIDAPEIVPFEYFRILRMKRADQGRVMIIAQAYNVSEMANFEVEANPIGVIDPPDPPGGDIDVEGDPCVLQAGSPYYDKDNQAFVIPILPCD